MVVIVPGVGGELGSPDRLAQELPVVVGRRGDRNGSVAGLVDVERAERRMAGAAWPEHGCVVRIVVNDGFTETEDGVVHAHVDELPAAGPTRVVYGGDESQCEQGAREKVAHARAVGVAV